MKKSKYKIMTNPLGDSYKFSFSYCIASEIGGYIFGGLIIMACILSMVFLSGQRMDLLDYIISLIFIVFGGIPFILLSLRMTSDRRKVKKIMAEGREVEGEIISYSQKKRYRRGTPVIWYTIKVKFDDKREQFVLLKVGRKSPKKALASRYCKVYILNDTVFITGFELRKFGEPEMELEFHQKY